MIEGCREVSGGFHAIKVFDAAMDPEYERFLEAFDVRSALRGLVLIKSDAGSVDEFFHNSIVAVPSDEGTAGSVDPARQVGDTLEYPDGFVRVEGHRRSRSAKYGGEWNLRSIGGLRVRNAVADIKNRFAALPHPVGRGEQPLRRGFKLGYIVASNDRFELSRQTIAFQNVLNAAAEFCRHDS